MPSLIRGALPQLGGLLLAHAAALAMAVDARADSPQVAFDVAPTIACREVTPEAFAELHPDAKVMEAKFAVSVRLLRGRERELQEISIDVESVEKRMKVFDLEPKTRLASDVEGNIEVVTTNEKSRSAGVDVDGSVVLPYGAVKGDLRPGANVGGSTRDVTTEKLQRLPTKQVVVVSGTTGGGHGAFFKLKPSSQSTLEGMHELTCRFVVPAGWQADWLQVTCRAKAEAKQFFLSDVEQVGYKQLLVGLYEAGSEEAQAAASALAAAQGFSPEAESQDKQERARRDPLAAAIDQLATATRGHLAAAACRFGLSSDACEKTTRPEPRDKATSAKRSFAARLKAAQEAVGSLSGASAHIK